MAISILYRVLGTGAFIYLFVKFLRAGVGDAGRNPLDLFHQNLNVNRRIRRDPGYHLRFVALLMGLFAFVASVVWMFHAFGGLE
jgi:succinate dehydrogenase/fumarate reductase cytochrome b subunit